MKRSNVLTLAVGTLLLLVVVVFTGCRGSHSGESGQEYVSTTNTGTSTTNSTSSAPSVTFNLSGAKQLVALSNTVAPASPSQAKGFLAALFGGNEPFQYKIVNQGLSAQEVRNRAKGLASDLSSTVTTTHEHGTNLIYIDKNGKADLAITADSLIKVMYSVTDPAGEYVYLALDPGFIKPDGNDYTKFIAQNNCALYRVKIADNSYSCVMPGVYVQPMDDTYLQRVSGNQKPIQFDSAGNMYFPGTKYTRTCDKDDNCSMNAADWNPLIYRVSKADGSVIALTQDNQEISYFLALTTGELAYQSINATTGDISLYLWQKSTSSMNTNGTTINLTGNTVGVDFFTVDNFNTIMWGGWAQNGVRFARPAASGVEKATLNTGLFKSTAQNQCNMGMGSSPSSVNPPRRIVVGDDGRLYGLFVDTTTDCKDTKGNVWQDFSKWKYYTILKIYQILPYSTVPKVELKFLQTDPNAEFSWQQWMGSTPFQVSNGYIYFKETREKLGYGTFNVIKMVSLKDRSTITLLGGDNDWYEIYNWRLKGNRLYFAALDLSKTVVVSGEIDTDAVRQNPLRPQSDYLSVKNVASALGATSRVQDIESLASTVTAVDGGAPKVIKVDVAAENLYSASVEFSKLMDKQSVENNLSFTDTDAGKPVASMKVWINDFLHLIPDLDNNGTNAPDDALLDLSSTTPLKMKTDYKVTISAAATDTTGTALGSDSMTAFQTKPPSGWYVSGGMLKFAGLPQDMNGTQSYTPALYDLNVFTSPASTTRGAPENFRVQFDAINHSWDGVGFVLYENTPVSTWPSLFTSSYYGAQVRPLINLRLSSWSSLNYVNEVPNTCWNPVTLMYDLPCDYANPYNWLNASSPDIFNGQWMTYRIDVYGSNLIVSYSSDAGQTFKRLSFQTWDPATQQNVYKDSVTDLITRDTTTESYRLFLRVSQEVDIDNLTVIALDSSGSLGTTLENLTFDTAAIPNGIVNWSTKNISAQTVSAFNPIYLNPNVPEFTLPANANITYDPYAFPKIYNNDGPGGMCTYNCQLSNF